MQVGEPEAFMERRQFRRLPAEAEVRVLSDKSGRARGKNISGNGILFESEVCYEPGTLLEIEVMTATHKAFSRVFPPMSARVRVVRASGKAPPFEIAAAFVEVAR